MIQNDISHIQDTKLQETMRHVFNNALGNVIILESAPTTAGGQLNPNEIGYYSTTLYINIDGTTYSIALTAV
jgi:hypothetical protein